MTSIVWLTIQQVEALEVVYKDHLNIVEFSQLVIVHCSSCNSCNIGRRICMHGARGRTVPEGECVHVRQCTTEIFISQTQQLDLKFYPMMD